MPYQSFKTSLKMIKGICNRLTAHKNKTQPSSKKDSKIHTLNNIHKAHNKNSLELQGSRKM